MAKKRLWIALVAIPISLASLLVVGAQNPHLASAGGVIDPTCTNSLPCIEYDNKGTGPGVKGTSAKGAGLLGTSTSGAGLTGSSASGTGVVGKSSTGNGVQGSTTSTFLSGVAGSATNGNGVDGSSTNGIGVNGDSSTARGVNGFSVSGTGVQGSSTSQDGVAGFSTQSFGVVGTTSGSSTSIAGVEGINNASTTAVRAKGNGGPLFVGNNSSGSDVFKVDNGGNMTVSGAASVNPSSSATTGLTSNGDTGVQGSGVSVGVEGVNETASGSAVEGTNSSTSTAIRANGVGGPMFIGNNSNSIDAFVVDDAGNVTITGVIKTGGSCSVGCSPTTASPGARIVSYAPREAEPTMEDVGEAQLVGGQAYVRLDPAFAGAIDQYRNYLVFITAEGDNRGLYVANKTLAGFAVRESQGGHSTLAFSYRIVAKPFGVSASRLPRVLLAAHAKHRPRLAHTPTLR